MNLQQLREKLEHGFYVDNLYEMASLCRSLALDTTSLVPYFIMEQIFLRIAENWEDRPLTVEEAKQVETKLIKLFEDIVEGIGTDAPSEEIFGLLNRLISAYFVSIKRVTL